MDLHSADKFIGEGLTYDDVLLVPAYSEVLPRDVNITSKFSRNIPLNTPIVSAAMDTVSESAMAIAIAREGGISVLHKNMSIQAQAKEVRSVKRAESGMILDPVTLKHTAKVSDAKRMMKEFRIGGIPVVDAFGKLIGKGFKAEEAQKEIGQTIEGLKTLKIVWNKSRKEGLDMPIVNSLYKIIYENEPLNGSIEKVIGTDQAKDVEFSR